jgi:serine/threonine protein kinase
LREKQYYIFIKHEKGKWCMKCPKCKADNPDDSKFCRKCATPLTKIPATLTSPPPEKEGAPEKSALDFAPGQYFGKRYQIIEEIGRGGMGRIYKSLDKELNRVVALKMIKAEISSHPGILERFKKEIKLASQIAHDNVCRINDLGEVEGIKYISMQFIEGNNLQELIQTSKILRVETAISITEQMCQALIAAHKKGVIHRDLKPQNVMIDKKGNAYVMDFGIARSFEAEEMTMPGAIIGTPHYMSPEQAEGKKADARSDIYSLGCILYEMLTGKPPFEADTSVALIHKHLKEKPKPPSKLNPQITKELEELTLKCLKKKPESRYQSAKEIKLALNRLSFDISIKAASQFRRFVRHWLFFPIVILIAIIVVIVGLNVGGLRERLVGGVKPDQIKSIAVLPLENLSGDPNQEYFSDGMTDALISNLAKIKAFHRVISRTSVMQYKGAKKSLQEIASELKVDAVVEGTVLRAGERVRITAQLIEARTDRHLWAESYERELSDILALQSEVAQVIVSEIKLTLTPDEELRLARVRKVDPEAYKLYLKGNFQMNRLSERAFRKAIEHYQQAIEKEPSYAPAYAGLASAYIELGLWHTSITDIERYSKAKEAALKALELDNTLAEAHFALARIKQLFEWDWSGADWAFKRGLELNPSSTHARMTYASYLTAMGRLEESITFGKQTLEIDPLSPIAYNELAWSLKFTGRYEAAIEHCQKGLELDPNFLQSHVILACIYAEKSMYEEAIMSCQKIMSLAPDNMAYMAIVGYIYAKAGLRTKAFEILNEGKKRAKKEYISGYIALLYAGLGEKEQAFEWLERAYNEHDVFLVWLKMWTQFDSLRDESRFRELLKKMNLE